MQSLKEKIKSSKGLLAPLISITDPTVAETLLSVSPDLIIVDLEHSVIDLKDLQNTVMAAGSVPVLARIKGNERNHVKQVLDTGVAGIIVPGIFTAEDAEMAVKYSRLPPHGIRGAGPGRASGYGNAFGEYLQEANGAIVMVQIETAEAMKNLSRIMETEGLDGYFIGPVDLSVSLGLEFSWENREFTDNIDRIVGEGRKKDLLSGIFVPLTETDFSHVKKRGFNFIMYGSDRQAMTLRYAQDIERFRKA